MKHALTLTLLLCLGLNARAQRLSHTFHKTSLSDALVWIDRAQKNLKLNFIYDELEDFTVSTTLDGATAEEAVRQVIGFYPVRLKAEGDELYMECIQKEEHKLCGRVLDEHGLPLEFATISLLSAADSCFINGGVSNGNGDFVIPCRPQPLIVRATFVGYQTCYVNAATHTPPLTIRMKPGALTIGGVVVKGEVPKVQLQGSSLLMNVENTVMARLGTAEDVLERVPMLVRRGEGYEIMGRGTPLIYLNGRKLTDLGELKNIQSDNIRQVEVIQNPGARYDATVNAVIIIRTKRAAGEGLGVELTAWGRRAHGYANNERLNLTYRTGGLELFANLFGAYNKNWSRSDFRQTVCSDTLWVITNNDHETTRNPFVEGRFGFNYQTGDHSFGGFYQHTYDYVKATESTDDDLTADGAHYDHLHNGSVSRRQGLPYHQLSIYYTGTVGKVDIDFNADYNFRKQTNRNTQQELSTEHDDRDVNTLNLTRSHMLAEKLTVSMPLWKGSVEAGEEFTYTRWRSAFDNAEGYINASNNEQHERNMAPFVELRQQWGRLRLQAGLRYEHVASEYFTGGMRRDEQCRTYDDLFPSVAVSAQLPTHGDGQGVSLSVSYAKRTSRPSYWQLSSDVIYENRLNQQTGNPYLKPVKYHNWSLMAMWRWLYVNVNYSHCVDPILYTAGSDPLDSKVNRITYKNYDHAEWLTVTLGAQKSITLGDDATWTPQWNVMLMKPWFKAEFMGGEKRFDHPMLALQLGNTVSLPHDWLLRADFNMHTHGYQQNAWFNCTNPMLTLSVSKDFCKGRLNVKLEGRDVFNGGINRFTLYSNRLQIQKTEDNDSRNINLTLRYRFNVTRSKYKGTGAGNAERGRL